MPAIGEVAIVVDLYCKHNWTRAAKSGSTSTLRASAVAHSAAGDENGAVRGLLILAVLATAGLSPVAAEKAETHAATTAAGGRAMPAPPAPEARVDINRASMAELLKVPGMTPSWAGRIVRFRPYHAKSDLLQRGVLPSGVYDRIKNYVIAHRVKKRE